MQNIKPVAFVCTCANIIHTKASPLCPRPPVWYYKLLERMQHFDSSAASRGLVLFVFLTNYELATPEVHWEDTQSVWGKNAQLFLKCVGTLIWQSRLLIAGVVAGLPDALPDSHSVLKDAKLSQKLIVNKCKGYWIIEDEFAFSAKRCDSISPQSTIDVNSNMNASSDTAHPRFTVLQGCLMSGWKHTTGLTGH